MPKSDYIPAPDHDLLVWLDHFIANLTPDYGVTKSRERRFPYQDRPCLQCRSLG